MSHDIKSEKTFFVPDAFFTARPPPEPQRIVLVGELPDLNKVPEKMKRLVKTILNVDDADEEKEYSSAIMNNKSLNKQKISQKGARDVRQLLHQLVSDLPVSDSGTLLCKSPSCVSNLRNQRGSMVSPRSSCNIAVQAHSEMFTNATHSRHTGSGSEDWLGGVRALRDSHVRLVQRQLRHIERLNRALDRVTRTAPRGNQKPVLI